MDVEGLIIVSTIICVNLIVTVNCVNVLAICSVQMISHFRSFKPLMQRMVERGYNLTLVSGFPLDENIRSKYTFIDMKNYIFTAGERSEIINSRNSVRHLMVTSDKINKFLERILNSPELQNIINSGNTYDLVLTEIFFHDALFALGYKFNAPTIGLDTFTPILFHTWISGNSIASSYIPNVFLPMGGKMTLVSRMINAVYNFAYDTYNDTLIFLFAVLHYEFISLPRSQLQIEQYFNFEKENTPQMKNIMKNISLILVNAHFTFGYPRPDLPKMVNIAGLHLMQEQSLPNNMQTFMDDAREGVIYFSLGSGINPANAKSIGNEFIRTMKYLPQKAIMKWNPKFLSFIPNNILVKEWIPQIAVLNHPNCRLFITHGGVHSILESLNASVPLIGIPSHGDQYYNVAAAEYHEIGMTLDMNDVSTKLSAKINEILTNPKYKQNIEKQAIKFRDRSTNPLDTAMYWVDYVIRHRGTSHLKSMSTELIWYERYLLDVFVIGVFFISTTTWVAKLIIVRITRKLLRYWKIKSLVETRNT